MLSKKSVYAILSSYAFVPEKIKNPKIIICDNIIQEVGDNVKVPQGAKIIDFKDKIILPGFIDVHIHGAGGFDFYNDEEKINKITSYLAKHGTTTCLATLYPVEFEKMKEGIRNLVKIIKKGTRGAKIQGINLEGPYISKNKAGVLQVDFLREINLDEIKEILEICNGYLKIITISPELKNAQEAINYLVKNNIVVSLGHSNANYLQTKKAISAGATLSTHTFNAMASIHHREPNIIGAVLTDDNVYCEVICDGHHIHKDTVRILYKCKNKEKVILITDAISCAGCKDGEYKFCEKEIILKNGRIKTKNGTLAGSSLSMNVAFLNFIKFVKVGFEEAVYSSSVNPARLLNLQNIGKIKEGNIADLIVVDRRLNVHKTIIEGRIL